VNERSCLKSARRAFFQRRGGRGSPGRGEWLCGTAGGRGPRSYTRARVYSCARERDGEGVPPPLCGARPPGVSGPTSCPAAPKPLRRRPRRCRTNRDPGVLPSPRSSLSYGRGTSLGPPHSRRACGSSRSTRRHAYVGWIRRAARLAQGRRSGPTGAETQPNVWYGWHFGRADIQL
jgi:hypothetical protein